VVEEIIRVNSVVRAGPRRVALEDVVIDGDLVPKGTGVILALHSANHDDVYVQEPTEVRPGRERGRSHMAFGFGLHQCLGQFLARQELVIALSALLAGFDDLRLVEPEEALEFFGEAGIYGVKKLRVAWRA
jgi:cytochrome P450